MPTRFPGPSMALGLLLVGAGRIETCEPLVEARTAHSATALIGRIYVVGGEDAWGLVPSTEAFDKATGRWTLLASIPVPRAAHAACAYGGKLHVFGGRGRQGPASTPYGSFHFTDHYIYDPTSDSWSAGVDLPSARAGGAAFSYRGRIYLVGGEVGSAVTAPNGQVSLIYNRDLDILDVARGTWTKGKAFPREASRVAAALVGGKIVVAGSDDREGWVEVYDIASGAWKAGAAPPSRRTGQAAAAVGGQVVVAGGYDEGAAGGAALATAVEVYLPSGDRWITAGPQLPTPRTGLAAAAIGDGAYFLGGATGPMTVTGAVEALRLGP